MIFEIKRARETDGRFISAIPAIPGCQVYAEEAERADRKCIALALRVLAEWIEYEGFNIDEGVSFKLVRP